MSKGFIVQAFLGSGLMRPLTDNAGVPYPPDELPCVANPERFDEDADPLVQSFAAADCNTLCPARQACWLRMIEMGKLARGVWAGIVIEPCDDADNVVHDATVASWLREAGIVTTTGGPVG